MKLKLSRFSILYVICVWFIPLMLHAQNGQYFLPTYLQKTPNSASLGKYGEYQVNMFSGVPDISIPLYEIESGGLKVPVTLSYHASGIKVIDVASWVGLGWSLSAGGEISRKVMGLPDESSNGYLKGELLQALRPGYALDNNDNGRTFMTTIMMGQRDVQPDIFSYDFSGHSGKFFFDGLNSYLPRMVPYSPVKVVRTDALGTGNINGFTITDEHGNKSFFGQTAQSSGSFSSQGSISTQTSSWMLEKMLSQDLKDTIMFSYNNKFYDMPVDASETITVDDMVNTITPTCGNPYTPNPGTLAVTNNASSVTEQQLNTILFKNGKVVFELNANSRQDIPGSYLPGALQDIKVYNLDNRNGRYKLLKTIQFYQTYFTKAGDTTTRRLRLDSVVINDAAGVKVHKYSFDYNSQSLPVYTSRGKDYWGYYNGKDSQNSLVPDTTIDYYPTPMSTVQHIHVGSTTTHARYPDSSYTQACMLQRIHYPTGGYTEFTYENNRYKDNSGAIIFAGGLRVVAIKSYDGINASPVVKTYQYSLASSRPNFHFGNYSFSTTQAYRFYPSPTCSLPYSATEQKRTFVSSPTSDIEAWDSTPVAYEVVTEYEGNGTANIGKTIYQFLDHPDAATGASYVLGKPFYDCYFFERGQLLTKSVYTNTGSGYQVVSREQNTYGGFINRLYDTIGFIASKKVVADGRFSSSGNISYGDAVGSDDNGQYSPAFYGSSRVIIIRSAKLLPPTTKPTLPNRYHPPQRLSTIILPISR